MTSYLLDILPAEIRCQIFEEVIEAQCTLPLQSEVFKRGYAKKRYQAQSPFHNLLRVNKQMRAEVQACLFRVSDSRNPGKIVCTKFDITRGNKAPLAKSRMQFRIELSAERIINSRHDLVYAQLGVFYYNYRTHYLSYLGDIFWAGKIDRELKKITLDGDFIELARYGLRNKKWRPKFAWVSAQNVAAAMGWEYPGSD